MRTNRLKSKRGFTLIELMVVIVVLVVLWALLIPAPHGKAKATRITCVNHLKQVGLAFRIWSGDHNNLLPMQTSVTNGGAMELALTGNVAAAFQIMSNELSTPKILFCPADKLREPATVFASNPPGKTSSNPPLQGHISYFVNLDAANANPSQFLTGDDNLLIGGGQNPLSGMPAPSGVLMLTTNSLLAWSEARHEKQGNVGLVDGSVQQLSTRNLRRQWEVSGVETNRLVMP